MSLTSQSFKKAGRGRAWLKNGVRVLHLKGTFGEMAGQHGALLKEDIWNGAVPFLGGRNDSLIRHSHIFRDNKLLQSIALNGIRLLQKPMMAQMPRDYIDEGIAITKATGLPLAIMQQTNLQADTLVLLMRFSVGRYLMKQLRKSIGLPGCTSIVALGNHTKSGSLIHARNMDYPVLGHWDPYPTVYYSDPDHGQRFAGITTAGVHTAGVTGVNESGITVSTHFHCTRRVSLFGTPIQIIGSEALRKAKTLGQFIDIVSTIERAGSWSMVVSSAKENKAAVIEMVHGHTCVREAHEHNGMLANTNMYRSEDLQKDEVLLSAAVAQDFEERYERALDLMKKFTSNGRKMDIKNAGQILGDHFDRELGMTRGQGNTISVITTVTSMISELGQNRFWVGNSCESPTSLGNYVGFDLDEDFKNYNSKDPEVLDWFTGQNDVATIRGTDKHKALRLFRQGYIAFHNGDSPKETRAYLEGALELDPEEGNYWLAMGHMNMRLKEPKLALSNFLRAKQCRFGPHMQKTVELFIAHAYDCVDNRKAALEIYRSLQKESMASPHVRAEAKRCIKTPYEVERAENMTFDLQFCDTIEYA